METIIIAERKRKCIGELIFLAGLLTGGVICLLSDLELFGVMFLGPLFLPAMGIVQYLWNVPSKIELSKEHMVIYFGRSIIEYEESGGSFTFPAIYTRGKSL